MEKNYLGVMLDCSRNAVMKVSAVKKFIDDLALMGYNCLQLYTEDTYEIDGEPLFGHFRGRYSQNELKEIDEYAVSKGIEVIPCIQTLAHLNCIFEYPLYMKNYRDVADILLSGEEKTYALIEKMFATMRKCFKSKRINIGMDEAHMLGLGTYLDKNGYHERFDILLKHLYRVCEIAKKYDFYPMMWSDMFFRIAFHGEYRNLSAEIPQWVMEKVPENVSLVYWDYRSESPEVCGGMLDKHLLFNREVWFGGAAWKWQGFHSGNEFSFKKIETAISECNKRNVNNILITLWGDDGNECQAAAIYPSLVYAAECAKGNFDVDNAKRKFEALFGENFDDFMLCDMKMPDNIPKDMLIANGVKEMLYCDPFLGRFDACVIGDGSESKWLSSLAGEFEKAAERSVNHKLMFESYAALAKAVAVKYDLGYRTRIAYKNEDKKALCTVYEDYGKAIVYIETFLDAFRKFWASVNKPQGFDVQDIRIGGLLQRLKYCKARLDAYIKGEITEIEELNEDMVDYYYPDNKSKKPICYNRYKPAATVNVLAFCTFNED